MPTTIPHPFTNIDGGNTRPADGRGAWVYWARSFKDAISDSRSSSATNPPFKGTEGPDGSYRWEASGDGTANNKLYLVDSDAMWPLRGGTESGQVHFKMSDNWQGKFYIRTENADYFEDNVQGSFVRDNWDNSGEWSDNMGDIDQLLEGDSWPSVWVQDNAEWWSDSRTVFVLNGDTDDYVSVDIDAEDSSIAQFRVRMDGENFFSNQTINDEVVIVPMWLRYWDASFVLAT